MNLDTLKVFCDFAETKSFSKAAEVNGITQSAVSQQVRALELKYQVSLVERNRRACALTSEGHPFLDAARRIVETYLALGDDLRSSTTAIAGRIRIAAEFSIGLHELPPVIENFREKYPDVEIAVQYLHSPEVCDAVTAGEADLGLVAYPQARPGLKFEIFAEDELMVICHPEHPLAGRASIELTALTSENYIAFVPDLPALRFIERQLRKHHVWLTPIGQFANVEIVKRAVAIMSGISLVPRDTVQAEVEAGIIVGIPLDGIRLERPRAIAFRAARARSNVVGAFVAALQREPAVSEPHALAVC